MKRFARAEAGVASVELAMALPLFALLVAGLVDIGGLLATHRRLGNAAAAGTGHALVRAEAVDADGADLARDIALLVSGNGAAFAEVSVNNGPTAGAGPDGVTAGGTPAAAAGCWCPTRSGAAIAWGAAVACGAPCGGGSTAGRFVAVTARRTYTPLFTGLGLVEGGELRVTAMARTG